MSTHIVKKIGLAHKTYRIVCAKIEYHPHVRRCIAHCPSTFNTGLGLAVRYRRQLRSLWGVLPSS